MITLRRELVAPLAAPDRESVLAALQQALCLEHATIPPYLYSLYSLDQDKNGDVAEIIRSVVVEEMLHMVLVANVMNALGGDPQLLGEPNLVLQYPSYLPGAVESGVKVRLEACSLTQVETVFMEIEQPEDPLNFQTTQTPASEVVTIGEFYATVIKALGVLDPSAFSAHPRHQVGPDLVPDAVVVTDGDSATTALDTIVHQGEGTPVSPGEVVGTDWAHYYRFAEIVHGHRLVKNAHAAPDDPPDVQWSYSGGEITLDPDGVYPVPTDPLVATYPPGSAERRVCRQFNYTYTNLLRTLHEVLTGQPERFGAALGLMMSLEQQAKGMASGETVHRDPGDPTKSPIQVYVGPSFEFQPVLEPEPHLP